MNEIDIIKALEKYVDTSSRKDFLSKKVRRLELEPSILKYLETILNIANSKEIYRVEKIIIQLDAKIKRLEDPIAFEERVGAVVLKKIGAITAIIGGIAAIAALIVSILK
jgi:hypothetical protein